MLRYFHGFQFRNVYNQLFEDLDVHKAVQSGIVKPGQYLILQFDFSRVARPQKIGESTKSLHREINLGLWEFRHTYGEHLGEFFESATSGFLDQESTNNLTHLIKAVDFVLQDIHDKGQNGHPLWDVRGIFLLADEYDSYANEYMDPHDLKPWTYSELFRVLKAFWSNVKAAKSLYGIQKVYITGVTPVLLC